MATGDFYFQDYLQWREALTNRCNIQLTAEYARERISALSNSSDPHTQEFTDTYGQAYLDQVIKWFQQAEKDACEG